MIVGDSMEAVLLIACCAEAPSVKSRAAAAIKNLFIVLGLSVNGLFYYVRCGYTSVILTNIAINCYLCMIFCEIAVWNG